MSIAEPAFEWRTAARQESCRDFFERTPAAGRILRARAPEANGLPDTSKSLGESRGSGNGASGIRGRRARDGQRGRDGAPRTRGAIDRACWMSFGARAMGRAGGLERDEFDRILLASAGTAQNFGLAERRSRRDEPAASGFLSRAAPGRSGPCARLRGRERARVGALYRAASAAADPRGHRHHRKRDAGPRSGRSALRGALWAEHARRRTALPAALVSRPRIADGLAADHAGPAACGSSSPQPPRASRWKRSMRRRRMRRRRRRRGAFAVGAGHRRGAARAGRGGALPAGGILS